MTANKYYLVISCIDQPGIIASVTNFLLTFNANIVDLQQHSTGVDRGMFYMRVEFLTPNPVDHEKFQHDFIKSIGDHFQLSFRLRNVQRKQSVIPLVSKMEHALMELLWKWRRGEIICDIPLVISNHEVLRSSVESLGIEFEYIPVLKEKKADAEEAILSRVKEADCLVLARYMQILSGKFLTNFGKPVINIHHSFLPAFPGAKPYERAFEKGVKLIGATSHYVIEELDAGPIIEQDTQRVSHTHEVDELKQIGREIERKVFANAVKWHLEERVIVESNKCIVFQ